jgi:hypothetical protein
VHPTALGQLDIADRAARALGTDVDAPRPSALAPAFRPGDLRYAPTHARMLWHDLVHRAAERLGRA